MFRVVVLALLIGCSLAAAPATSPKAASTTAAVIRPLPPSLMELHVQAFELIRQGDYRKAAPLLEKIYKDVPAPQRNRALVLNHAIVDASQKTLVMRAIKDLTDYLTKNRDPDEAATNILGVTLNLAAGDARLKRGDLWQTAFREWDRRNYVLDHSRKGWRRWGTRWLSDDEYALIQDEIKRLKKDIADQEIIASRAYDRLWTANQQYINAVNSQEQARYLMDWMRGYGNPAAQGGYQRNSNPWDPNFGQYQASPAVDNFVRAYGEAQRLGPEVQLAMMEFRREQTKLAQLENKSIRPEWPTTFEPVDPTGPDANKSIDRGPTPTTVAATAPSGQRSGPILSRLRPSTMPTTLPAAK